MGNLRKSKRNLNEKQVWIAKEVDRRKKELAKAIVKERIEKDAEFAKDVLKSFENNTPALWQKDLKEAAEKTIAKELYIK